MAITLLCPNNHKLVCPESQAGKRGKCPQCGATFRVPELPASVTAGTSQVITGSTVGLGSKPSGSKPSGVKPILMGSESDLGTVAGSAPKISVAGPSPNDPPPIKPTGESYGLSSPGVAVAAAAPGVPDAPPNPIRPYHEGDEIADDEILFLCPSGHHLCGSTTLGGHPGECPECGAKFLVPSEEDLVEAEPAEEDHNAISFDFDVPAKKKNDEPERHEPAPTPKPLALIQLFESLWAYRQDGATVELHLGPGKVVTPDGYAPHLSQQGHGVFMVREANGSHTLMAVNWTSITHVAVRGVKRIPEGVFE